MLFLMKCRLIILLLVLITGAADCMLGLSFRRQFASEHYLKTIGIITQSRVERGGEGDSDRAFIQYTYDAGGNRHSSSKVRNFYTPEPPGETVARYPVGLKVAVYYDPRNPDLSVLSPGLNNWDFYAVTVFAFFNLLAGGAVFVIWWKYIRARTVQSRERRENQA
jgi:hypothetical protein